MTAIKFKQNVGIFTGDTHLDVELALGTMPSEEDWSTIATSLDALAEIAQKYLDKEKA